MKDTIKHQVTPMPSCLADYTDLSVNSLAEVTSSSLTTNENCGQVRRSAAMIGLAISMGATGLLLASNKAAVAANSLTAKAALSSLPASFNPVDTTDSPKSQLAPLTRKHKVKLGESIGQLAQDYQVEAVAIATLNQLSVETDLVPGQVIKIPTLEESQTKSKKVRQEVPHSQKEVSKSVNTSLDHLRETRKRLQDSLAELKTEKSNLKPETSSLLANVSDVSQPLRRAANEPQANESLRETALQIINSQETESVVASGSTTLLDPTFAVSSPSTKKVDIPELKPTAMVETTPQSKEDVSSIPIYRQEATSQNSASALSSLTKLPSVPPAKIEQEEIPQFNEPVPIRITTSENAPSSTPNESRPELFNAESPQELIPTQQARVVPKPQVTLTQNKKSYRVKPGDTLNSIARRHGITVSTLIQANGITNPNLIKIHQSLVIPQSQTMAQSRDQPQHLLKISQSQNLVASSPSRFPDSPLPIPVTALSSRLSTEVKESEKKSSHNDDPEMIEISVTPSSDAYTEQLKADIANLEREYAVRTEPGTIEMQPETPQQSTTPVVGETLNPEWASDRRNSSSSQQQVAQQLPQFRSRLVGAAPNDTEQYNDAFRIPVGTNVGPELPPLSVPDNYLPDAPMQFTGYIWPSKGVLTSGYGPRWGRMHRGIDIAAPIGTPIVAAAPGEVITAGWNSGGYGKLVKVRHPDGSMTLYAHNSRLLVRRGQKVEQGQQIAEMGSTGYSTGPHLHFEVHPNGRGAVNPMALLPKNRK